MLVRQYEGLDLVSDWTRSLGVGRCPLGSQERVRARGGRHKMFSLLVAGDT